MIACLNAFSFMAVGQLDSKIKIHHLNEFRFGIPLKIFHVCRMRNKKEKISSPLLHSGCGVSLLGRKYGESGPQIIILVACDQQFQPLQLYIIVGWKTSQTVFGMNILEMRLICFSKFSVFQMTSMLVTNVDDSFMCLYFKKKTRLVA